jgi:hypothetical protein
MAGLWKGRRLQRWVLAAACAGAFGVVAFAQQPITVRTPATPLVLHDPYFSVWSFDDELNAGPTRHWTGAEQQLDGFVRVDGKSLRFMGNDERVPWVRPPRFSFQPVMAKKTWSSALIVRWCCRRGLHRRRARWERRERKCKLHSLHSNRKTLYPRPPHRESRCSIL